MDVIRHDDIATDTPEESPACHDSMISLAVSSFAKRSFRRRVQTVRKIIIDLNPIVTVGKCAGLLCGFWRGELCASLDPGAVMESSLGVAELRSTSFTRSRHFI